MSDTRRSGRATKGVTTKNKDIPDGAEQPKSSKKGKAKPAKKDNQPGPDEEEDDDEENAIIRCICGQYEEDDEPRTMVCCDKCLAWQHNDCMGITEDEDDLPEHYFCEQCRPGDHKVLLAALKRGERPWEAAQRRREEIDRARKQKKGKKGKTPRQSKAQELVKDTAGDTGSDRVESPAVSESNKRKLQTEALADEHEQPAVKRKSVVRTADEAPPPAPSRKGKARKSAVAPEPEANPIANSIEDLSNESKERHNVAKALRGKIETQITSFSKQNIFRIPDGHTASSLSEELAIAIEHAMFVNHAADTKNFSGPYSNQFRSILSNIVQNTSLLLRLLKGSLSADELANMSSDDMASEELQKKMQEMKEEVEKQSILVNEEADGPRVRRTHKGDEFVDEPTHITSESMSTGAPAPRRTESMSMAQSPVIPDGFAGSPMQIDTSVGRRSSSNFDINNVWSSVQTPDHEQIRALKESHKRASINSFVATTPGPHKQEHDADIDRLLQDDADDGPTTPGEYAQIGTTAWRGIVSMPNGSGTIATFKASAFHVAGNDLYGRTLSLSEVFPPDLIMAGRIAEDKADEYLMSLAQANSTDVSVCRIVPDKDEPTSAIEFDNLFQYFVSRKRWGVVGDVGRPSNVRDCYVVPIEAGAGPIPASIEGLAYSIIEQPRSQNMFLVVFVTKWADAPTTTPQANALPTPQRDHPEMSTISPHPLAGGQPMHFPGQVPPSIPHGTSAMSPVLPPGTNIFPPPGGKPITPQLPFQGMPPPPLQHGGFPPPPPGYVGHDPSAFPSAFPANPYAPPPQQYHQQQQFQSQPPRTVSTEAQARDILGPYFHCPTAQTIMQNDNVPEDSLRNLRQIFDANEATRTDMEAFKRHLENVGRAPET